MNITDRYTTIDNKTMMKSISKMQRTYWTFVIYLCRFRLNRTNEIDSKLILKKKPEEKTKYEWMKCDDRRNQIIGHITIEKKNPSTDFTTFK